MFAAGPSHQICPTLRNQFKRQRRPQAVDPGQVLAQNRIERAAKVEARLIGLTAHAPARRRQGSGIGPMGAQRLEDGLDPLIARRHLVLIGVVQRQRLFEREQMLGAIMPRQSLLDRLGAGVTPDVP